ncbi:hypothetical protein [Stenotrophomonas sp. ESTM1D_MKCIP4_1]|uniref:hypothetical protein n=1 Tax=Stenotrophomonas sp. ESTM1D_MKCIP4_1 TaxID=2072414 RepID=UPI0020B13C01|nr:hypothetical protein [Stenotrophomonas sp. ESTM1D_MKCIP4_1]
MVSAITPLPPLTVLPLRTLTVVGAMIPVPLTTIAEPLRPMTLELSRVRTLSVIGLVGVPPISCTIMPFSSPVIAEPLPMMMVELEKIARPDEISGGRNPVPMPVPSIVVLLSVSTPPWT